MSKLRSYKLGKLLSVKHGFPFLGEFFSSNGEFIILTPGNFFESGGFKRTLGKEKYYTADFPKEYLCSAGDLTVAMTEQAEGLLGSTAIIPESGIYLHNQRIGLITWNEEVVDKMYLYYLFMTRSVRKQLRDTASGTKVKHTSPERIYDVDVLIPDKAVQKKNAALLWAIDQKIQLNNRINAELESMAKTIYEYWFVQFDFPNAEGKPYRKSGGEMVWNAELKRSIPMEWSVIPVSAYCDIVDCLHSKKPDLQFEDEHLYLLQLENLSDMGLIDLTQKYYVSRANYEEWTSRIEVKSGDLVITNAGRVGAVARIPYGVKAGIGRNMTALRPHKNEIYMYYFFMSSDINGQIKANTDSGSFFGSLNVRGIKELKLTLPPQNSMEVVNNFEKRILPLRVKIETLAQENLELNRLRNWLLPMLMNGQVTVE